MRSRYPSPSMSYNAVESSSATSSTPSPSKSSTTGLPEPGLSPPSLPPPLLPSSSLSLRPVSSFPFPSLPRSCPGVELPPPPLRPPSFSKPPFSPKKGVGGGLGVGFSKPPFSPKNGVGRGLGAGVVNLLSLGLVSSGCALVPSGWEGLLSGSSDVTERVFGAIVIWISVNNDVSRSILFGRSVSRIPASTLARSPIS